MDDIQVTKLNSDTHLIDTKDMDENRSPTSGSSSETTQEPSKGAGPINRKHRRHSRAKRKRKWKPYTELSWDERKVQDDRETKRAFAKRERLSAKGHPIAPYNTTQFLMDDHKLTSPDLGEDRCHQANNQTMFLSQSNKARVYSGGDESSRPTSGIDSPLPNDGRPKNGDEKPELDSRDEIQRFILQDFSHAYADYHAEQLQAMSKTDLISECIRLEKKVESLERKVKNCQKKHKDEYRNQADVRLLDKINQLQTQNAQLIKENASMSNKASYSVETLETDAQDGSQSTCKS